MLDYPLILPVKTEYDELSIGPEVGNQEIRTAQHELIEELRARCRAAQTRLQQIYAQVEGLEEALRRIDELRQNDQTDPMEILNQERRLAELQQTARELDPDFAQLHDRVRELEQQEEAVNRMRILKADRADYDREHPPLELLKLENCTRDEFALDSPLLLWLLRRELGRFLRIRGEAVFHPSDLTRDDFRSDFTKNKYLDDPQR